MKRYVPAFMLAAFLLVPVLHAQTRSVDWRNWKDGVGLSLSLYGLDTTAFPDISMKVKLFLGTRAVRDTAFTTVDVTENGVPQNATITCALKPLSVALVLDKSLSMAFFPNTSIPDPDSARWNNAKAALHVFIDQILAIDRCALISFARNPVTDQLLTPDKKLLHDKLEGLKLASGTGIWIAVDRALTLLSGLSEKTAIILLTDGEDNSSGSTSMIDVADRAASLRIPVYTVGLGEDVSQALLGELASRTGGKFFFSATGGDLTSVYQEISSDLVEGCTLTYRSTNFCTDGARRNITVTGHYNNDMATADTAYTAPLNVPTVQLSFPTPLSTLSGAFVSVPLIWSETAASAEPLAIAGSFAYAPSQLEFVGVKTDEFVLQGTPVLATAANGVVTFSASTTSAPVLAGPVLFEFIFRVLPQKSSLVSTFTWNSVTLNRLCARRSQTANSGIVVEGDCEKLFTRRTDGFLGTNYPNPVETFSIVPVNIAAGSPAEGAHAELRVLDPLGVVVATLHSGPLQAGEHRFAWDCGTLPTGRYSIEFLTGTSREQRQAIIVR